MALRKWLADQFSRPHGFWGSVAGVIMARRRSNRERIFWTISLLKLQPGNRVLEIGFGPGISIRHASETVDNVFIVGIDHSETMVRQARKRNSAAIREGRVELLLGSVTDPPDLGEPFDKIFAINAVQFLTDRVEILKNLRKLLKPGGLIAITVQPRLKNASNDKAQEIGQKLVAALEKAGFYDVRFLTKEMKPVNTVCALGRNP